MRRTAPIIALAASFASTAASAQAVPDYASAMESAARDERAGRPRDAATSLEALAMAYPEDHVLSLRLGWLWFGVGVYDRAQTHYARALALSAEQSFDARLGLAWTLLRLHEATAARAHFERLAAQRPDRADVREGLALSRAAEPRAVRAWASLWIGAQIYQHHPQRRFSLSVAPSVTVQLFDRLELGATYRAVSYDLATPQPGRPPTFDRFTQQEFHASLGLVRPSLTLRLHVGRLWDAQNTLAPATVLGVSGRFAAHGQLVAEASATIFSDVTVPRVALAWAAALTPAWSLGPTGSVQLVDGAVGGSLGAQLAWASRGWGLSLAGRWGDERRLTSLNESLTFATNDRIRGAASVAFRAPLGGGISLAVQYEWLHLLTGDATRATDAEAHFLTAAVLGAW